MYKKFLSITIISFVIARVSGTSILQAGEVAPANPAQIVQVDPQENDAQAGIVEWHAANRSTKLRRAAVASSIITGSSFIAGAGAALVTASLGMSPHGWGGTVIGGAAMAGAAYAVGEAWNYCDTGKLSKDAKVAVSVYMAAPVVFFCVNNPAVLVAHKEVLARRAIWSSVAGTSLVLAHQASLRLLERS